MNNKWWNTWWGKIIRIPTLIIAILLALIIWILYDIFVKSSLKIIHWFIGDWK
jgi:hypothetical protein